jgi:hypothetical protein
MKFAEMTQDVLVTRAAATREASAVASANLITVRKRTASASKVYTNLTATDIVFGFRRASRLSGGVSRAGKLRWPACYEEKILNI